MNLVIYMPKRQQGVELKKTRRKTKAKNRTRTEATNRVENRAD